MTYEVEITGVVYVRADNENEARKEAEEYARNFMDWESAKAGAVKEKKDE